ncbi:NAD(P)/FAD-dependent oxidoreductase [Ornithinibacillus scapharcae]|uniref:NAD(P)/FAD-dependent oxidoreductase n=1 Tax=Ornithinibacillus scapharcae TaxID=1147159 RepID=UPI000225BD70|nr:FAD-dependent oxidoreductase [Ornithinibacillus scapharcae]
MNRFIVVGAGILGASTAYHLAKNGAEVLIIDRKMSGQATNAAAGVICPWLSQRRNKAWYQLAKNGAKIYPTIINELEKDGETNTGYAQVGAISLHRDEKKLIAMQERALKRRKDAPEIGEVSILNSTQTRELVPYIDEVYSAVHVSGAARVDGRVFRNALLNAAQKYGAKRIDGKATIIHRDRTVIGIKVEDEVFEANTVIAACGAWMNDFLSPLGINFSTTAQRGQVIHVQIPELYTGKWPVIMPPTNQSIVPFENHIVIGATHENDTGFDLRVTAGGIHDILSKALDVLPGLENSTFIEARVGFRPFTPGFLPIIGNIPGFDGLLIANGLGSSGLTTGPYLGIQLAKLALGQELEINLADYPVVEAIN